MRPAARTAVGVAVAAASCCVPSEGFGLNGIVLATGVRGVGNGHRISAWLGNGRRGVQGERAGACTNGGGSGLQWMMVAEKEDEEAGKNEFLPPPPTEEQKEVTSTFYEEVKKRFKGKDPAKEEDVQDILFETDLYTELRKRRDFGIEQELYLELTARNSSMNASSVGLDLSSEYDYIDPLTGLTNRTTVLPNSQLSPNDMIMTVLESLRENDKPYVDHGVEVFCRFTSPLSVTYDLGMEAARNFLADSRHQVLLRWDAVQYPRPLVVSTDGTKAYQLMKLRNSANNRWEVVRFTCSRHKDVWLLDSAVIKLGSGL